MVKQYQTKEIHVILDRLSTHNSERIYASWRGKQLWQPDQVEG
jgi:hypothetical protein